MVKQALVSPFFSNSLSPERRLIAGIIKSAVEDLHSSGKHLRKSAENFLSGRDGMLRFWLNIGGFEIDDLTVFEKLADRQK